MIIKKFKELIKKVMNIFIQTNKITPINSKTISTNSSELDVTKISHQKLGDNFLNKERFPSIDNYKEISLAHSRNVILEINFMSKEIN